MPLVLSTSDPFDARMGSGGGTIAALDYADEMWEKEWKKRSAGSGGKKRVKKDAAKHEEEGPQPPSVLVVHAGGESSRCPTQMTLGKAWTSLPLLKEPIDEGDDDDEGETMSKRECII
eukprot:1701179-Ditylum_brightwellii.AAC.1